MKFLAWVFLLEMVVFSFAARAQSRFDFDLRYISFRTQKNTVQQSLVYVEPVYPWLELSAGVRLSEATQFIDGISYMGQASFTYLSWGAAGVRLLQVNRMSDTTASTVVMGKIDLHPPITDSFGVYASIGYYKAFTQLSKSLPVPTWTNVSFTDEDFTTALGFWLQPLSNFSGRVGIGTFEDIDIYNLNNPFVETQFEHLVLIDTRECVVFILARYQLLLGFGRSDSISFGIGLRTAI